MVLHLPSGPRASHDCSRLPCGSHSLMRPELDVQTWPRESAKMPITWPHLKSAGSLKNSGSGLNCGAGGDCSVAAPAVISRTNARLGDNLFMAAPGYTERIREIGPACYDARRLTESTIRLPNGCSPTRRRAG